MNSSSTQTSTILGFGFLALALTMVTGAVWTALLIVYLQIDPAIPWAPVVMAILQWLIWQVDAVFGLTAGLTDSILPGLAIHFAGLLIFFSLIWPYDPARRSVTPSSADMWFWPPMVQTFIFAVLSIIAFRQFGRITGRLSAG